MGLALDVGKERLTIILRVFIHGQTLMNQIWCSMSELLGNTIGIGNTWFMRDWEVLGQHKGKRYDPQCQGASGGDYVHEDWLWTFESGLLCLEHGYWSSSWEA